MKFVIFIVVLIFCGCTSTNNQHTPKQNNSASKEVETKKPAEIINPVFKFITEKEPKLKTGLPSKIPKHFQERGKYFPKPETKILKLDTNSLRRNYQYLLAEQNFLVNSNLETNQAIIYFFKYYSYMLSKRLRIFENDTTYDLILAENQGDGQIGSTTYSKFYEDGKFIETTVREETVKDFTHVMAYNYDTIIKTYLYDENLNFELLKRDSLRSYVEYPAYYKHLKDSIFSIRGLPFLVNGFNCNWIYEVKYSKGIDENSKEILVDLVSQRLVTFEKGEKILLNLDLTQFVYLTPINLAKLEYTKKDNFPFDINHDGTEDFVFQTESAAGGANNMQAVYRYNSKNMSYEYDSLFSGYNITYDTLNNRISSFWKTGGYNEYYNFYLNLDSTKKKVLFTEEIKVRSDTLKYTKRIENKIVDTKVKLNYDGDFGNILERKK